MGRKRKERPSKYNKRRLPAGFYVNRETGKVTQYGEGPSAKKNKKNDESENADVSNTDQTASEVQEESQEEAYPEFTEDFTENLLHLPSAADFRQKIAKAKRREEIRMGPPMVYSETDESDLDDPPMTEMPPTQEMLDAIKINPLADGGPRELAPDSQFVFDDGPYDAPVGEKTQVSETEDEEEAEGPHSSPVYQSSAQIQEGNFTLDATEDDGNAPGPPDPGTDPSDDEDTSDDGDGEPLPMSTLSNLYVRLMIPYPVSCGIKTAKFMFKHREAIKTLGDSGQWRDFQTMRRKALAALPPRKCSAVFYDRETGQHCEPVMNVAKFPRNKYPTGLYGSVWESASVQLSDLYAIHIKTHPDTPKVIDLSIDGVSKDKSSLVPVDVYSVRFTNCNRIYNWCVVRIDRYKDYDIMEYVKECAAQITRYEFRLRYFIGDSPILSKVRGKVGHTGFYACPICQAPGQTCKLDARGAEVVRDMNQGTDQCDRTQREALGRSQVGRRTQKADGGSRVYGLSTLHSPLWTNDEILQIVSQLEMERELEDDERMGIRVRSALFDIEGLDLTVVALPEIMHLWDLGILQFLVMATFKGPEPRVHKTSYKRQSTDKINLELGKLKWPSEFRLLHILDPARMKAQQFRNLGMFTLFSVIASINPVDTDALRVRRLWALVGFAVRAIRLPKKEFSQIPHNVLKRVSETLMAAWIKTFGLRSCVYNVHVAIVHLLQIRTRDENGAASKSAYLFEDSYSRLRNDFNPSTDNICLQILNGNLLRNTAQDPHSCFNKGRPRLRQTRRHDDSWFYFYYVNEAGCPIYKFYKLIEVVSDDMVNARVLVTEPITGWEGVDGIPFQHIGIHKKLGLMGEPHLVPVDCITGKAVQDNYCIYSIPTEELNIH